jgi:DNA polymerase-3 subunit epsilon
LGFGFGIWNLGFGILKFYICCMNLKLERPIACIDLETTGVNVSHDRIVEISIIKIHPDGKRDIKTRRINPTIPIPKESSDVHGIFDADVAGEPTFKELANGIKQFLENCDLCGYNSNKFDFPMLTEEFLRIGMEVDFKSRHQIDVQQIFYKKEPRTLGAAYKFYCNKTIENAHSAEADALATVDILEAQITHYEDLGDTVKQLHDFSKGDDMLDYSRRVKLLNGIPVFNFGKHKDKPVAEVFKKEHGYYDWIMKGDFSQDTKQVISKLFNETMLKKS